MESPLTIGVPVHAWRKREIDATGSVGPLECMPNKIAEVQFCHVTEKEGLLSLSLSLNGNPIHPEVLDNFPFEVHQRFLLRRAAAQLPIPRCQWRRTRFRRKRRRAAGAPSRPRVVEAFGAACSRKAPRSAALSR